MNFLILLAVLSPSGLVGNVASVRQLFSSLQEAVQFVKVTFVNNVNHDADFEQRFSRYRDYPASQDFSSVEAGLVGEIVTELCEDVFNKSVVNW